MLVISVFALLLLAIQTFSPLPRETQRAAETVDTVICVFFLIDFLHQTIRTRPATAYLKWGWLDLLASIPMFPALRVARLARIARIIRVLRGARASRHMISLLLRNRARNTFWAVAFGSVILILFSAVAIVNVESTITPRDAFWWSLFTLITGEYGGFYPDTTEGRLITALLMTAGVALFGTFTATVASYFLEDEQEEDETRDKQILAKLDKISLEIDTIKQQLKGQSDGLYTQEGT